MNPSYEYGDSGLWHRDGGEFLDSERTLKSYNLKQNVRTQECGNDGRSHRVAGCFGDQGSLPGVSYFDSAVRYSHLQRTSTRPCNVVSSHAEQADEKATVGDCFEYATFNMAGQMGMDATELALFASNGGPYLRTDRRLWSIPLPKEGMVLKTAPQNVTVNFQGTEAKLLLDAGMIWRVRVLLLNGGGLGMLIRVAESYAADIRVLFSATREAKGLYTH